MHFTTLLTLAVGAAALPSLNIPAEARDAAAAANPDLGFSLVAAAGLSWAKGGHNDWRQPKTCDLSKTDIPTFSGDSLPAPTGKLAHVLLGRGTQNYTCDTSNPTSAPVAIGALATLYGADCIAANLSPLLSYLPMLALMAPNPPQSDAGDFFRMDVVGHHYFVDSKSPVFNLQTQNGNNGYVQVSKVSAVNAPSGAMAGPNGAVSWLYLARNQEITVESNIKTYSSVYRVNTAGGNPPATCQGQDATFEIDYAAEYWFYE